MVAPKREGESSDRGDRPDPSAGSRTGGGLTERLRGALLGESDEDLVLDRSDAENGIAQWLRALDLQVLGACRADERLQPLLKLNISSGVEEDRLLARLGQHFDASEVGMLARCLCIPLVSIRVGKVKKQGNLLSPTATRGHLNLSLLSSSNMRISFTGDDGCTEKLAVVSNVAEGSEVVVEEISADTSGRSFVIKLPGSEVLCFWCSEKSKDRGMELLAKMKNLLRRKPSLARLTGICESRLDSFATHIRAYLLGSSNTAEADLLSLSGESSAGVHASDTYIHSPPLVSKSSRCRFTAAHTKGQPSHQGSLSPRPNTFKDGTARSSSSIRNNIKEKLKRRGDTHNSSFLSISPPSIPVSTSCTQSSHQPEDETVRGSDSCSFLPSVTLSEMHCISSSSSSSIPLLLNLPSPLISSSNSLFSPYYCLCPPCPSALQYPVAPSRLPITFNESMPLPPLSSLLSAAVPPVSLVTSSVPLNIPSLPTLNLPSLFPESFARLSIPVTSLITLPTSQQISTFSGYMSDPIVHTPVIDVCSSGQGYLVSAGPAMSSVMPPLLPSFKNHPLISSTESAVENSARETLRMLMASPPKFTYQKPMIVIPGTDGMNHNATVIPGSNHDVAADVSQGLYGGAFIDVEAVAMGLSSMGLSLSSSKADGCVKIGRQERNDHGFTEESLED